MLVLGIALGTPVFSRGDYLFTDTAITYNGPVLSDVAQIASHLVLPYWFWGGLITILSGFVLVMGIVVFFRHMNHGSAPGAVTRGKRDGTDGDFSDTGFCLLILSACHLIFSIYHLIFSA